LYVDTDDDVYNADNADNHKYADDTYDHDDEDNFVYEFDRHTLDFQRESTAWSSGAHQCPAVFAFVSSRVAPAAT